MPRLLHYTVGAFAAFWLGTGLYRAYGYQWPQQTELAWIGVATFLGLLAMAWPRREG